MTDKTFREKYVDQKFDKNFLWVLMTEFICTIIFIFGIMNLPQLSGSAAFNAFTIAAIATSIIYAFGPRCGAPFNPAIVTGLMCGGKMNIIKGLCYIVVELLAGLVAGGFYLVIYPDLADGASSATLLVLRPGPDVSNVSAIFMEMITTFILVFVVFRVAAGVAEPRHIADESAEKNKLVKDEKRQVWMKKNFLPIAIGFTLGFLSFPSSFVSGGGYNPARALGGCVVGTDCSDIWIYFIGEFIGGALAGLVHFWLFEWPHSDEEEIEDPYLEGEPAAVANPA